MNRGRLFTFTTRPCKSCPALFFTFGLTACLTLCLGSGGCQSGGNSNGDGGGTSDGGPTQPGGQVLWDKGIGGPEDDFARVVVDQAGSVVVAGGFQIAANLGGGRLQSAGDVDVFVAKYGQDGAHMWSKRLGGVGPDLVNGLAIDGSGNVVMAGSFQGVADFGGGQLGSMGDTDVFVARYDGSGKFLWAQRFGGPGADSATAVAVDASGNVLVGGSFSGVVSFGGDAIPASGDTGLFLAKYDPTGKHLWSRRVGGPGKATLNGLFASGADVLAAGSFEELGQFGGDPLPSFGGQDVFIARYMGKDGTHVWSKRFGGPGDDAALGVSGYGNGDVILAGSFEQTVTLGGSPLASLGLSDVFLARFGGDGKHQWSKRFGGQGADAASAVAVASSGDVVIAGSFRDAALFGGAPLASVGEEDVFVARLGGDGKPLWSRRFGGPQSDVATSAAMDASGNITVAGTFHLTANFGDQAPLTSNGKGDGFVARLAP